MPASRSSRQPSHAQHGPSYKALDVEVIVLSSDEDGAPPPQRKLIVPKKTTKSRGKSKAKLLPAVELGDILEISSEDDAPSRKKASSSRSTLAHFQKRLEALQLENDKLKAEVSSARASATPAIDRIPFVVDEQTLMRLKADEAAALASKKKLLCELEENVTCEICTLKMWTPYLLSCGHSFCKDCLTDWFSTTQAQHMATNPGYHPHPPMVQQYMHYLRHPHTTPAQRQAVRRDIQAIYDNIVHPSYTCPTCREPVTAAPIESFALKSVVRTVAEAEGETSPKRIVPVGAKRDDLWDGFFPKLPKFT